MVPQFQQLPPHTNQTDGIVKVVLMPVGTVPAHRLHPTHLKTWPTAHTLLAQHMKAIRHLPPHHKSC